MTRSLHPIDRRATKIGSSLGEKVHSIVERFLLILGERAEPLRELVGPFDLPHHH